MEYIIVGFVILLIWGNISRRKNPVRGIKTSNVPTAGDNFNSGCAIVAGVCEPPKTGTVAPTPAHILFPVDPPPIAIQKKTTIYPEGTLIGRSQPAAGAPIGMIQNGKLRWIPDPNTFTAMNLNINNVQWIPSLDYDSIPKGQTFPKILPASTLPKVNPVNPVRVVPTHPIRPIREADPIFTSFYCGCGGGTGGPSCGLSGSRMRQFEL